MASSGNFCVLNPLPYSTYFRSNLGKGNLFSNPGNNCMGFGTMALTSGKKWYMEGIAQNAYNTTMGIFEINDANTIQNSLNTFYYNNTSYKSAFYHRDGTKYVDGSNSSYGATFAIGDVIGMAVDLESGTNTITFYKNNASQGSFNLGTNGLDYLFCMARGTSGGGWFMNFGQDSTFGGNKTAGGNADDSGFGDFFYAVPSGHLAVCSANLGISDDIDPAQTDTDYPGKQFNTVLYTGNGSTNAITGLGFKPDLVWVKRRNSSGDNRLVDSSRGVGVALRSNVNGADVSEANGVTAFGTDGFTLGSEGGYNASSDTFVGWCWRANGGTTTTDTSGDISTVRQSNTASGFAILTWSGNGSNNQRLPHGLGKKPAFVIAKRRDAAQSWGVWTQYLGANSKEMQLDSNSGMQNSGNAWYQSGMTTDFVGIGSDRNHSSSTNVAYVWADVEGMQRFGIYEPNTNSDGPFVYTGFRPRMVFIKMLVTGDGWGVWDTARSTHNVMDDAMRWNLANAETNGTAYQIDVTSSGFKIRTNNAQLNHSSYGPYMYGAWSDVPFKYGNTF